MITIRMWNYSAAEKIAMEEILAKAVFDFLDCNGYCESCKLRNLCADLQSALLDVLKQIKEAK